MEYWLEVNICSSKLTQTEIIERILVRLIKKIPSADIISWHFFYEVRGWKNDYSVNPHIRFRVQTMSPPRKDNLKKIIKGYLNRCIRQCELRYYFGRHGDPSEEYVGEKDRFGKDWDLTKMFLEINSEIAIRLLEKGKKGDRFCKSDLLHFVTNIFGLREFTTNKPSKWILLEEKDLPKKVIWKGA